MAELAEQIPPPEDPEPIDFDTLLAPLVERPIAVEAETILPSQLLVGRRCTAEELLMLSVIWTALWDLNRTGKAAEEARRFFSLRPEVGDGETRGFDLEFVADHFGWDVGRIRCSLGQLRLIDSFRERRTAGAKRRPKAGYKGLRQRRLGRG